MNLFYQPTITKETTDILFSKEESRHISKVLRKNTGDILHVTNGLGNLFTCQLVSTDIKKCMATITKVEIKQPQPYQLHLAVAPTKLNDRYEWFLEKATEIGITTITPIICEHSERKVIKPERYEKILVSAMKQSLKFTKPVLNITVPFSKFIKQNHQEELTFVAHCEDDLSRVLLKNTLQPQKNVLIIIGPEGDFSTAEIQLAIQHDFIPISLGESRLRTETAAIVACHSVSFVNQTI